MYARQVWLAEGWVGNVVFRVSWSAVLIVFVSVMHCAFAAADDRPWPDVLEDAKGQAVYWHAWGGDRNVNQYIDWVADEVRSQFGVTLRHVKVRNISETVTLLMAEKAAGRSQDGRIDLLWLNGENFAALKSEDLLYGPFAESLPNFQLVDTENKPTTVKDFTIPTEGFESPWGMAQLIFYADRDRVKEPPNNLDELAFWLQNNPGRFTYPAPPDFTGTTWLKQILWTLISDKDRLYQPVQESDFVEVSKPLWEYLDLIHPHLWRSGRTFPQTYPALRQLLSDREIDIAFSFNPAEVANAILNGSLPPSVAPIKVGAATIGNTHFVAIPRTSGSVEGALVVANFLLSPRAQAHKADPRVWGDPTVLDVVRLPADAAQLFADIDRLPTANDSKFTQSIAEEPHPSWTEMLEKEWRNRYAR